MAIELPQEYADINRQYADYMARIYHTGMAWPQGSTSYPDVNPDYSTEIPDIRPELTPTEEIMAANYSGWANLDPGTKANILQYGKVKPAAGPYGFQLSYNGPSGSQTQTLPDLNQLITSGGYLNMKGLPPYMSWLASSYGSPTAENYKALSSILNPSAGLPIPMPRIKAAYQTPTTRIVPAQLGGGVGGMSETWNAKWNNADPYWDPALRQQYGMAPLSTQQQRSMGDWYIAHPSLPVPNYVADILPLGVLGVGKAPLGTGVYP